MKFIEQDPKDPAKNRTTFHKWNSDVQLAIEELNHTLAALGYQVIVKKAHPSFLDLGIYVVRDDKSVTEGLD